MGGITRQENLGSQAVKRPRARPGNRENTHNGGNSHIFSCITLHPIHSVHQCFHTTVAVVQIRWFQHLVMSEHPLAFHSLALPFLTVGCPCWWGWYEFTQPSPVLGSGSFFLPIQVEENLPCDVLTPPPAFHSLELPADRVHTNLTMPPDTSAPRSLCLLTR